MNQGANANPTMKLELVHAAAGQQGPSTDDPLAVDLRRAP
jgi:hypothetical protein